MSIEPDWRQHSLLLLIIFFVHKMNFVNSLDGASRRVAVLYLLVALLVLIIASVNVRKQSFLLSSRGIGNCERFFLHHRRFFVTTFGLLYSCGLHLGLESILIWFFIKIEPHLASQIFEFLHSLQVFFLDGFFEERSLLVLHEGGVIAWTESHSFLPSLLENLLHV